MIRREDIFGILLPLLTICLFVVLIISSLIRLSTIEEDMRIEATQNMLWVITRAQVGSLELQQAASLRVEGQDEDLQVGQQLNNFLSYYKVLNDGPQRRQMDGMGLSDALDKIEEHEGELERLIANLSSGDDVALSRIREILWPYDAMLARAANKAMVAEWEDLGAKLDHSRNQVSAIFGSMVVIAIAGAGMTFYLVMASRSATSRARLLEQEKAFSQLLVASSIEGIVATDMDGCCTLWNDAVSTLIGVGAEEALHKPIAEADRFFSIERVQTAVTQALNGTSCVLDELPLFADTDAAPIYLDLRCYPLRDGAGIIGSILLISDVTEQYHAKRKLRERRDYLEEQVLLRTQELNAALARERATTEIYRNFAAMVSHQFRTPLAIVDSALQRLMRRARHLTTEQIIDKGEQARSAILRLVRLVERTLDVARLDNGQIDKQTRPSDLDRLITAAIRRQSDETPDRDFDYTGIGPVIVDCDPVHTEHIIANLLSNAAKYALPGTPVRIEPVLTDRQAGCRISNEGRIDPDDQPHLFERYFRGSNAREQNGVGLGLYMARSLARLQDGEIWLEEGTDLVAFIFALPMSGHSLPRAITGGSA